MCDYLVLMTLGPRMSSAETELAHLDLKLVFYNINTSRLHQLPPMWEDRGRSPRFPGISHEVWVSTPGAGPAELPEAEAAHPHPAPWRGGSCRGRKAAAFMRLFPPSIRLSNKPLNRGPFPSAVS